MNVLSSIYLLLETSLCLSNLNLKNNLIFTSYPVSFLSTCIITNLFYKSKQIIPSFIFPNNHITYFNISVSRRIILRRQKLFRYNCKIRYFSHPCNTFNAFGIRVSMYHPVTPLAPHCFKYPFIISNNVFTIVIRIIKGK